MLEFLTHKETMLETITKFAESIENVHIDNVDDMLNQLLNPLIDMCIILLKKPDPLVGLFDSISNIRNKNTYFLKKF